MNFFKENNGITLAVLVITIIVLLIISGITINTVVKNKIIDKAKNSATLTNKNNASEEVTTAWTELLLNYPNFEQLSLSEQANILLNKLNKNYPDAGSKLVSTDEANLTITVNHKEQDVTVSNKE